jgi:predicted nucleic acid-binding protein
MTMRVLLDTNLVIAREDPASPPVGLSDLLRLLADRGVRVLVHPITVAELEGDRNQERRSVVQAKARSYPVLEAPPVVTPAFANEAGGSGGTHDDNDIAILFAVRSDAVNLLVTEDKDLIHRATRTALESRVLSVSAATEYFRSLFSESRPVAQRVLRNVPVHELIPFIERGDPFFESIREDYPGFDKWVRDIAREGRKCIWMPARDESVGALLIYKDETEPLLGRPTCRRLKLCTFKVSDKLAKQRLSEMILSWGLFYAYQNGFPEAYLTVLPEHQLLIDVLVTFGFRDIGSKTGSGREERVLLKELGPKRGEPLLPPVEFFKRYFPLVRRDASTRKYLVPVEPEWHARLFPEYRVNPAQTTLADFELVATEVSDPAGNAIRKAYLCHSPNRSVTPGSLLLFYRSRDAHLVTHFGVAEEIRVCTSLDEVLRFVGNRTVIPLPELTSLCESEVLAVLFWSVGPISKAHPEGLPIGHDTPWPQSITALSEEAYARLCS